MAREEADSCPAQPHINIKQWYKYKNLRTLNILLAVPLMTSFTLGFDSSMFGALQASDAWQHYFNYPVGTTLASLGAAPIIAAFPALAIIPFTSDRIGRRWSLFLGCMFVILGGALQAASMNVVMYGFARASIGFGSLWCQTGMLGWFVFFGVVAVLMNVTIAGLAWVVELAQ